MWDCLQLGQLRGFLELAKTIEKELTDATPLPEAPSASQTHCPEHMLKISATRPALSLLEDLRGSISCDGSVEPTASPALKEIHDKLFVCQKNLDQFFAQYLQRQDIREALSEVSWTFKEERHVLPVRADRRSQVPGKVRAVSATGATLFIEPPACAAFAAERDSLLEKKMTEETKIITKISDKIRQYHQEIQTAFNAIVSIDVWHASAACARFLKAEAPQIFSSPPGEQASTTAATVFQMSGVRHPLLILENRPCVLNSVVLSKRGKAVKTLVISGPNAGGKTFLMRTIGLLCLMAKSGLFVPADDFVMPDFDHVYLEMGDNQSIYDDLSTFSAHLKSIKNICERATSQSLVLIDEGFVGTDPALGVALARATLEALTERGCTTLVTTHFTNLKILADEHPAFMNGSMAFVDLKPTFEFQPHVPGSSFAFELAERLELDEKLILRAKDYVGKKEQELEQLLKDLHDLKCHTQALAEEQERLKRLLSEEVEALKHERAQVEKEQLQWLDAIETGLQKRFNQFNHSLLMAQTRFQKELGLPAPSSSTGGGAPSSRRMGGFDDLKDLVFPDNAQNKSSQRATPQEAQAKAEQISKEHLQEREQIQDDLYQLRERVALAQKERQEAQRVSEKNKARVLLETELPRESPTPTWLPGQKVKAAHYRETGEVLIGNDNKNMVLCQFGGLKMRIEASQLTAAGAPQPQTRQGLSKALPRTKSNPSVQPSRRMSPEPNPQDPNIPSLLPHGGNTLDIRGQRAEEGVEELMSFLDACTNDARTSIVVIHGHGTGRLKEAIRQALGNAPYSLAYRPGRVGEGGDGATVVQLN